MTKELINTTIINGLTGKGITVSKISPYVLDAFANIMYEAIYVTRCCESDSELLKVLGEHIAEQFDHKAEDVIEQLEWKFKNL